MASNVQIAACLFFVLGSLQPSNAIFSSVDKQCYGALGCFSTDFPFNHFMEDSLPDPPSHIGLRMFLQTRKSPMLGHQLRVMKVKSIESTTFDVHKPLAFVVHGYESYYNQTEFLNLTRGLLRKADINVVGVDWKEGAHRSYPQAVANTRMVGSQIAYFIGQLEKTYGVSRNNVHVIGHSLGAQIAGYVGQRLHGLGRITGLDPAGPLYSGRDPCARLDKTDAVFVDIIHTDGAPWEDMGFGDPNAIGDIDFYPNGGKHQPGCPPPKSSGMKDVFEGKFTNLFNDVACSHTRAVNLFTASMFNDACSFTGHHCAAWKHGPCTGCGSAGCPEMGYSSINSSARGVFYLRTAGKAPYCIHD